MTDTHPLDRPFWNALNGPQAALARWNAAGDAVRIDPAYGPFAGGAPGGLASLLAGADDEIWLVEPQAAAAPGLALKAGAELVQMVAEGPVAEADFSGMVLLDERHAPAMEALALATRPGPWRAGTHLYGDYYGLFEGDRLVAMAGERSRPGQGWAEVSGVCTDPAFRGRGLAARLIGRVLAGFAERGDAGFLHSWASNAAAIGLYERLGFRIRRPLVASVLVLG